MAALWSKIGLFLSLAGALVPLSSRAEDQEFRIGSSVINELKYQPGFTHFDYVNTNAPKGGDLRLSTTGTFDTFNPLLEKGEVATGVALVYDTLMTGTTGAAWNDPVRGGELTKNQIDQGADVVYAAAGATGLGVLQTAADNKKLSIGVDSNQNHLHPGSVLTSMVKRVDLAVYNAYNDTKNDKFTAGVQALGVKEDGVGAAIDDNNKSLITPEMQAAVDKAKADIIAGTIKVHDYTSDNACPK